MKRYAIDTSSLLSLVRYYQPFDGNAVLISRIEELFGNKTLVLLNAVKDECEKTAKGKAMEDLPFLKNIETVEKFTPTLKQHRKIDHTWIIKSQKDKLIEGQYDATKAKMLNGADFQLIFYALNQPNSNDITVVTEETTSKDGKLFHKIPTICRQENIECLNLPEMLLELRLSIDYHWK